MLSNENIANISKYLFILLLFCLPLSLEKEFLNTGTKLLWLTEPICAVLTFLLGYYIFKNRNKDFTLSQLDILTFIFLASVVGSTIFSNDYYVSIKFTISLIWYFTGGYLVVRMFDFTKFQQRLSVIMFFLGTALLCLFVLKNFMHLGIFYETSYQVSAPFIKEGHTDLSVVIEPTLLMSAVLLLLIPLNNIKKLFRIGIITTLFLAVIMFSCSKASYAALFLAFGAFALILIKKNPKYIIKLSYFLLPVIIIAGIWKYNDYKHIESVKDSIYSYENSGSEHYDPNDRTTYKQTNMIDELFNQSRDTDKNDSNKERINRWTAGLHLFIYNPSFGIGMGTYPDKYLDYQTFADENIVVNYLTENRMNLHNIFLGWLVEGGIITFLSGSGLILLFFWWFYSEWRKGKNMYLKILLFVYMISFIFHGLFHDFSQNARVIIPFWVCLAIVSRQMAQNKKRKQKINLVK